MDNTTAALIAALEALIPPPATSYHGLNKDCPHARLRGGPCPGHAIPDAPKVAAARAAMKEISARLIGASMMREDMAKIHRITADDSRTYPQIVTEISLTATTAIRRAENWGQA